MTDSVVRVKTIFHASRGDFVGVGSSGIVFTVNSDIVVKTACRYDVHPPGYAEEEQYSVRRIKEESAVFDVLAEPENWHSNIVLSFLHSPDYIFMERAHEDLFDHVTNNFPISLCATGRFLNEIINAVSWLEQMGILHCDVRPPNILIDYKGQVKLCDFDNVCLIGQDIQVGNTPYYEESETGNFGIAGTQSEQGAIGCCAYFICTGMEPQNRSHSTSHIHLFGAIIRKCWNREYQSVIELSEDISTSMDQQEVEICHTIGDQGRVMNIELFNKRVAECKDYLSLCGLSTDTTSVN